MNIDNETLEKLISLESRLAFTEDTINGLNSIIADQNAEIAAIKAYCRELKTKLDELAESDASSFKADQKPPHY